MTESGYQLVFSTCPEAKTAETIARALVEDRLAACVNILSPLQSIYRWQGSVETAQEVLLLIKIRAADYARVEARICELHPYELPEVIGVPLSNGLPGYLAWLENPDRSL